MSGGMGTMWVWVYGNSPRPPQTGAACGAGGCGGCWCCTMGLPRGRGTRGHTPLCHVPRWNTTVQTLVASYEAYEDLMKKSQEGKDFYTDLEGKAAKLLEKARAACQAAEANRQQILEK